MNSSVKSTSTSMGDGISQKPGISAKTCTCGGAGCANCGGQGYVRPRFFAGQLLTEEDLQSLSDYVVTKNRLHNRHFFGDGVVCGLEVACHPCGGGTVVVAPGYALDCCGNDIVLNCPTELDINAMVREFRINTLGGYDCGDPCDPPKQTDRNDKSKKDSSGKDQPPARRYYLYIRYYEEQTDPVIPYGTDEPCVSPDCEPTRIREGVRFELRCDESENPDNLFTRIGYCFADLIGTEKSVSDAAWHKGFVREVGQAHEAIRNGTIPVFDPKNDFTTLDTRTKNLNESLCNIKDKNTVQEGGNLDLEAALQEVLDATLEVTSLLARFLINREENRAALQSSGDYQTEIINQAASTVESAAKFITEKDLIKDNLPTKLRQSYAVALIKTGLDAAQAAHPSESEGGTTSTSEPTVAGRSETTSEVVVDLLALLFLAQKVPMTSQLVYDVNRSLEELRDWLLVRLDQAPSLTDCTLRQEVLSIRWYPSYLTQRLDAREVDGYIPSGRKLVEALLRYLRDCICRALNPPCPPCNDTAVLLACLKVRDCEVIEICNLERTFVLSPVALRYWVPPLHWLGEFIEKVCCRPIRLHCEPTDYWQGARQLSAGRWSETELLGRAKEMLADSVELTRDDDRRRFMRILSALGDLICSERRAETMESVTPQTPSAEKGNQS